MRNTVQKRRTWVAMSAESCLLKGRLKYIHSYEDTYPSAQLQELVPAKASVREAFWYSSRRPDASGISHAPCTSRTQEMTAQKHLQSGMYRIQVTRCVDVASDSGSYGVSQHSCKAITSLPCVMTIAYQLCPARFSVAWPGQIAGMPTMAKRGCVQPHLSLYIFTLCIKSFFETTSKLDHFQHAAALL